METELMEAGAIETDFMKADFVETGLMELGFKEAGIMESDLEGANFMESGFMAIDLRGVDVIGINFMKLSLCIHGTGVGEEKFHDSACSSDVLSKFHPCFWISGGNVSEIASCDFARPKQMGLKNIRLV